MHSPRAATAGGQSWTDGESWRLVVSDAATGARLEDGLMLAAINGPRPAGSGLGAIRSCAVFSVGPAGIGAADTAAAARGGSGLVGSGAEGLL